MNSQSSVLDKDSALTEEEFDLDVMVVALMAMIHARQGSSCILRGSAFAEANHAPSIWDARRNLWFSATYQRRRGEVGVTLTARRETSTGPVDYERWIPMESFHDLKVKLKCEA